jgi:hypothetical protein
MSPLFPLIQSSLDLNGPVLSFSTQPVGTSCSIASGIATFTGIATATFPTQTGRDSNTGTISYRWYKGSTVLADGSNVTGSGTTILTLSGLTDSDNKANVFLRADYTPSAYGIGSSSPNAINDPIDSNTVTLTVLPTISIDTQPIDTNVVEDIATTFSVAASASDGTDSLLGYQWYLNGSALSDNSLVSGSGTKTLTITRENPDLDRVYCEVSHSTAQPGIVTTTEVNLDVASARTFITWELIGNGTRQATGNRDLATAGRFWARARTDINARIIQIFSPEKDVDVKITLGGAKGADRFSRKGGEGGVAVFKMTLKQNTEYTVKLGINSYQGGGPRGGTNGGGGLAVIYEKARVIAVCGGGGGAGINGNGGAGGGCSVAGESGQNGAAGGAFIGVDALPSTGMTQAGRTGFDDFDNGSSGSGRLSGCTIGGWWRTSGGKQPCEDVGTGVPFRNNAGGIMSDTTKTSTGNITRGYKTGQGHRNNGGAGSGNGGGGGAGARGGQGSNNGGGGGASGYIRSGGLGGAITLLDSTTLPGGKELGGNDDVAFISVEAFSNDDKDPFIPPKTSITSTRTVNWRPSRNAGDKNTLEFRRLSGNGPEFLRFGPNADQLAQNSQIVGGTVYQLFSANNENGRGLTLRIQNNVLQGADNPDNLNYGNIQINPDQGVFSSGSTLPVKIQGTAGEGSNPQPNIRWTANW